MTAKRAEMARYASAVPIPAHLRSAALSNQDLISQVVKDGFDFLFSRCKKQIDVAAIVAIVMAALMKEYEAGTQTKVEDFNFGQFKSEDVGFAPDGKLDINVPLPDDLHQVAISSPPGFINDAVLNIAPAIRRACGGDAKLAAVVCTMVAHLLYYDADSFPSTPDPAATA